MNQPLWSPFKSFPFAVACLICCTATLSTWLRCRKCSLAIPIHKYLLAAQSCGETDVHGTLARALTYHVRHNLNLRLTTHRLRENARNTQQPSDDSTFSYTSTTNLVPAQPTLFCSSGLLSQTKSLYLDFDIQPAPSSSSYLVLFHPPFLSAPASWADLEQHLPTVKQLLPTNLCPWDLSHDLELHLFHLHCFVVIASHLARMSYIPSLS